jgi:hypothetical protein
MNLQTHQLFAQLCESIIFEASTTMDLIKGLPGGQEVVKYLHQNEKLSHDQPYKKIDKISWSDLKDNYRGSWVIMKFPRGVGAIKQTHGSYMAVSSSGGDVETFNDSRGGNIMDFFKEKLGGKPSAFYTGSDKGAVANIRSKRADQQKGAAGIDITTSKLVLKFKPLWVRAATAAIADIKGMVGIMVKNDSFDKASTKLSQLRDLSNALSSLESDDNPSVPNIFNKSVQTAVILAASHYYPDDTQDITRAYGGEYRPGSDVGVNKLLSDISGGDTKKLGTILSFFKRSLIS